MDIYKSQAIKLKIDMLKEGYYYKKIAKLFN